MASAADRNPPRHTQKMQGLQQDIYAETSARSMSASSKLRVKTSATELIGLETAFSDER